MLEFYVVGVSLGTAWAHPSTGDTVASVMIGGLRTVQNGAFPIHTNDLICIYFDDERDFFEVIDLAYSLPVTVTSKRVVLTKPHESVTVTSKRVVLTKLHQQENGGRKPRKLLTDDTGNMDVFKVVEWVSHGLLDHAVQHNEPTGHEKLRKVRNAADLFIHVTCAHYSALAGLLRARQR